MTFCHPALRTLLLASGAALCFALPGAAQERAKHLTLTGIPSATVAPAGLGFAQISGTTNNHNDETDGSMAVGFGLGNAQDSVGVQATLNITSLKDDFADTGYLTLKFSRALTNTLYAGLEVSHLAGWGDASDVDPNAKIMLTWFSLLSIGGASYPIIVTAGVGENMRWDETEAKTAAFAGIGIGLTEHFAASIAYTGEDWEIGLGARVTPELTLTAAVEDAFDQNDARKLVLSASYAFNLFGR